jgi:hypothetical protein
MYIYSLFFVFRGGSLDVVSERGTVFSFPFPPHFLSVASATISALRLVAVAIR